MCLFLKKRLISDCLVSEKRLSPHLSSFNTLTFLVQVKPQLIWKIRNRSQSTHDRYKNVTLYSSTFITLYEHSCSAALAVPPPPPFKCLFNPTIQQPQEAGHLHLLWVDAWINLKSSCSFWHRAETNSLIQEKCILYGIELKQLIKYLIIL